MTNTQRLTAQAAVIDQLEARIEGLEAERGALRERLVAAHSVAREALSVARHGLVEDIKRRALASISALPECHDPECDETACATVPSGYAYCDECAPDDAVAAVWAEALDAWKFLLDGEA